MTDEQLAVYAILDEALVCHVSYVLDGEPRILPTLHARDGDTLLLHGSSGSRLGLLGREAGQEGLSVCVAVTLIDGVVLARSAFNHSVNFRSVVVHGRARLVTDVEREKAALDAFINQLVPHRTAPTIPAPPTRRNSRRQRCWSCRWPRQRRRYARTRPISTIPRTWACRTGPA
ncbi:pyridoxamine 5'-phosphate oxidase family protein [Fodinicola feengrottensis]|uniref:pyridoxamine 5'-phosphate oxidase family protein n=1 Tax=Fodinicola feengrottensis TaxID=435914 RepID=UPI00244209CE|nr:pyridoxamine 5'-phosphate oxidase family protein [Fodinicola feengrottensis]